MEVVLIIGAVVITISLVVSYNRWRRQKYLLAKYHEEAIVYRIMRGVIWQGMSEEQLVDSWGTPVAKDQKVYRTKTTEIFKYNQRGANRFGSRVRVDNGVVVGWDKK
jgi:hypothetical protein